MDSFFGIGFPELVFILILAGLVMGPHRIRQVARTLGRLVGQMQTISNQFKRQLNAELDALDSDEVRGAMEDMKQLRREVDDLRQQVRSIPEDVSRQGRQAVAEGERAFKPVSRQAATGSALAGEDDGSETVSQRGSETPSQGGTETPSQRDAESGANDGAEREAEGAAVPTPDNLPKPIEVPDDPQ